MTRIPHDQMAFELAKMVHSKRVWLSDHGAKYPAHEVEIKKQQLTVLEQARADYERSAKRSAEA